MSHGHRLPQTRRTLSLDPLTDPNHSPSAANAMLLISPPAVQALVGNTSIAWLGLGVLRLSPGVDGGESAPYDEAEDGLGDRPE